MQAHEARGTKGCHDENYTFYFSRILIMFILKCNVTCRKGKGRTSKEKRKLCHHSSRGFNLHSATYLLSDEGQVKSSSLNVLTCQLGMIITTSKDL